MTSGCALSILGGYLYSQVGGLLHLQIKCWPIVSLVFCRIGEALNTCTVYHYGYRLSILAVLFPNELLYSLVTDQSV